MKPPLARLQHGRSWFELGVVAAVIGVIGWFWIGAVLELQAQGEKTTVDLTIRNMRTGLQLQMTDLMIQNRAKEIPSLAGQNPVQWLAQPPDHYLGEVDRTPQDPPPASWYFDRRIRALVYVPGAVLFARIYGESGWLAWQVAPGSGMGVSGMAGIRLAPIPAAAIPSQ